MDKTFIAIYGLACAVYFVFGAACFARAITNGLQVHRLRFALVVLGVFMWCLAATVAFRIVARMVPSVTAQAMLNSAPFALVQVGSVVAAVVLFFVLQKPGE
jgi:hypothetical protein